MTLRKSSLAFAAFLATLPASVGAQFQGEQRTFTLFGLNVGDQGLLGVIGNVIAMLVLWLVPVCITVFLVGAFIMVLNAGREEKAKQGKTLMTGAVMGLVAALLSYAIVRTVFSIFIPN